MSITPIVTAFTIAVIGAAAVGLRPGYSLAMLLLGATVVAALTGIAASAMQFLPNRAFVLVAVVAGSLLGLLVLPVLARIEDLGFGDVRRTTALVWPVALVAALLLSRGLGMRLPLARRRSRRLGHR